ncbi:hypothetical protein PS6_011439 [Mucor atramentarius]
MKLRSKTRHAVMAIKREKQKEESIKLEAILQQRNRSKPPPSNDTFAAVNDDAVNIKEEDLKEYVSADDIEQEESPTKLSSYAQGFNGNTKDYFYQCHLCKEVKDNLQSVLDHRKTVHGLKSFSFKHIDVEPNIYDPNNFCQTCERAYSDRRRYRTHLRQTHYIFSVPLRDRLNSDPIPDPEKTGFYCRSCCCTYNDLCLYRSHLKSYHNIRLAPSRSSKVLEALPNWNDPDLYCRSCNKTYRTRLDYTSHCKTVHRMKIPANGTLHDELPDIRDPKFYCKICNITHQTERAYRNHCYMTHKRALVSHGVLRVVPDSNRHCAPCDKSFSNKYNYHKHLFVTHKIGDPSKLEPSKLTPDINDPNLYCRACDKTLCHKYAFVDHLRQIHGIGLRVPAKGELEPDVEDPNNHCRSPWDTNATAQKIQP